MNSIWDAPLRCPVRIGIPIDQRGGWGCVMTSVPLTSLGAKLPPVSHHQAMSPRLGSAPWQQRPKIWQQSQTLYTVYIYSSKKLGNHIFAMGAWGFSMGSSPSILPKSKCSSRQPMWRQFGTGQEVWRTMPQPLGLTGNVLKMEKIFPILTHSCDVNVAGHFYIVLSFVGVECVTWWTTSLQLFYLGMPQHLVNTATNSLPRRYNESPHDVFMLIKGFVSDRDLSQPPLLVWPGDKVQESFEVLCKIARNEVNSALFWTLFLATCKIVQIIIAPILYTSKCRSRRGLQYGRRPPRSSQRDCRVPQWQLQSIRSRCCLSAAIGWWVCCSKSCTSTPFLFRGW